MDGFFIILALLLFSVFRNVIREAQKKSERPGPDSFEASRDQEEARDRAIEALRRWQEKQERLSGPGSAKPGAERGASPRIPRGGEHRTELRLPSPRSVSPDATRVPRRFEVPSAREAERTRREAYDAIRGLLAGTMETGTATLPAVRPGAEPAPLERSGSPVKPPGSSLGTRPKLRGTVQRELETTPTDAAAASPGSSRRPAPGAKGRSPAGLGRLDALPPVARGLVYAELLGRPLALRERREGIGD